MTWQFVSGAFSAWPSAQSCALFLFESRVFNFILKRDSGYPDKVGVEGG